MAFGYEPIYKRKMDFYQLRKVNRKPLSKVFKPMEVLDGFFFKYIFGLQIYKILKSLYTSWSCKTYRAQLFALQVAYSNSDFLAEWYLYCDS